MDKSDTTSKCTALELKQTKAAMYIFNGGGPRILRDFNGTTEVYADDKKWSCSSQSISGQVSHYLGYKSRFIVETMYTLANNPTAFFLGVNQPNSLSGDSNECLCASMAILEI